MASLIELPLSGFKGATVQICSFTFRNMRLPNAKGSFVRLVDFKGGDLEMADLARQAIEHPDCGWLFEAAQDEFKKIPGRPVAYWVSQQFRKCFENGVPFTSIAEIKQGMATSDNNRFIRQWHEVAISNIAFDCKSIPESADRDEKWYPYKKGGEYRKWFGNDDFVVNWHRNGMELKEFQSMLNQGWNVRLKSREFYFKPSINWSFISSSYFGVRQSQPGFIFDVGGSSAFPNSGKLEYFTGLLCSKVAPYLIRAMNPTLNFQVENIAALPINTDHLSRQEDSVRELVEILISCERNDWNAYERSWTFQLLPLQTASSEPKRTLKSSYTAWVTQNRDTIAEMKRLEEENNRLFIDAYGLQNELSPGVPIEQITLTVNPAYRYGKKVASGEWSVESGFGEELETRFREDTMQELVSYAIGCAMGRYRLDRPGLIYAHSGNERFWEIWEEVKSGEWRVESEGEDSPLSTHHSSLATKHFPPDADGIIPITDTDWFDDDATHRVVEFISVAWRGEEVESGEWRVESEGKDSPSSTHHSPLTTHHSSLLEQNLSFLANNLSPKKGESSRETLRRYLADKFFKDHLQTYKNRPIYWCFTSGKQKAFQCLVYLHRYNEGTLARMRMEYVVPLQSKMAARIDKLGDDIQAASTSAQAKRLQKERDKLTKQLEELRRFDEQLRHYADQRIQLDLDDGVKVNYGKFGDLLAGVKSVTGKASE